MGVPTWAYALIILEILLCVHSQGVQWDWTLPVAPDYTTTLSQGQKYTIGWTADLEATFADYCQDCDSTSVQLWVSSVDSTYYSMLQDGIDVSSTSSVDWDVDTDSTGQFVFRFVSSWQAYKSSGQQISSAAFLVSELSNSDQGTTTSSLTTSSSSTSSTSKSTTTSHSTATSQSIETASSSLKTSTTKTSQSTAATSTAHNAGSASSTTSPGTSSTAGTSSSSSSSKKKTSTATIAGGAIAGIAVLGLLLVLGLWYYKRSQRRHDHPDRSPKLPSKTDAHTYDDSEFASHTMAPPSSNGQLTPPTVPITSWPSAQSNPSSAAASSALHAQNQISTQNQHSVKQIAPPSSTVHHTPPSGSTTPGGNSGPHIQNQPLTHPQHSIQHNETPSLTTSSHLPPSVSTTLSIDGPVVEMHEVSGHNAGGSAPTQYYNRMLPHGLPPKHPGSPPDPARSRSHEIGPRANLAPKTDAAGTRQYSAYRPTVSQSPVPSPLRGGTHGESGTPSLLGHERTMIDQSHGGPPPNDSQRELQAAALMGSAGKFSATKGEAYKKPEETPDDFEWVDEA